MNIPEDYEFACFCECCCRSTGRTLQSRLDCSCKRGCWEAVWEPAIEALEGLRDAAWVVGNERRAVAITEFMVRFLRADAP